MAFQCTTLVYRAIHHKRTSQRSLSRVPTSVRAPKWICRRGIRLICRHSTGKEYWIRMTRKIKKPCRQWQRQQLTGLNHAQVHTQVDHAQVEHPQPCQNLSHFLLLLLHLHICVIFLLRLLPLANPTILRLRWPQVRKLGRAGYRSIQIHAFSCLSCGSL